MISVFLRLVNRHTMKNVAKKSLAYKLKETGRSKRCPKCHEELGGQSLRYFEPDFRPSTFRSSKISQNRDFKVLYVYVFAFID